MMQALHLYEGHLNSATWNPGVSATQRRINLRVMQRIFRLVPFQQVTELAAHSFLDRFESKYIEPLLEGKILFGKSPVTPKTVRNHIYALKQFAYFVKKKLVRHLDYVAILEEVRGWVRALSRRVRTQTRAVAQKKSRECITPELFRQALNGRLAECAKLLLASADSRHFIELRDFCSVRNFLMLKIVSQNANRCGILTGFTRGIFEDATFDAATSRYVFTFSAHKTAYASGPAYVSVDEELYAHLAVYVNTFRSAFVDDKGGAGDRPLFCTAQGKQLKTYNVTKYISNFFKKEGHRYNVSCTTIRRLSASTAFACSSNGEWRSIAKHMKHSTTTSEQYYVQEHTVTDSCKASANIDSLLTKPASRSRPQSPLSRFNGMDQSDSCSSSHFTTSSPASGRCLRPRRRTRKPFPSPPRAQRESESPSLHSGRRSPSPRTPTPPRRESTILRYASSEDDGSDTLPSLNFSPVVKVCRLSGNYL